MPARPLRKILITAAAALALLGGSTAPALAHGGGPIGPPGGDGSQPLPGYTIANPPLTPVTANGEPTRVVQGVYEHAAFDLEVPADWNGELVLWAHGYRGQGTVLTVDTPGYGLRQTFVNEGYAWAASSYYDNGYDVAAGVISEHDLAQHAASLLGRRPYRTYIAGVSMGGHIIGRSLEQYPNFYAGALPMCGVLGDDQLFDFFLDYNLVAQDLAGVKAYPPPADYLTNAVPTIEQTLGLAGLAPGQNPTNALGVELQQITVQQSGGPRPGALAAFSIWKDFLFTLFTPDTGGTLAQNPGRLAQNVGTVYTPTSPVDVNPTVTRVAPTDLADRLTGALTASPQIVGDPKVPVLSLHGLGDMFVPFSMEEDYARDVAAHGESDLLVQRAIRSANHCEFDAAEAGSAWNDLVTWVQARGQAARAAARPAGDDVLDPAAVASPSFGCRFSDPAAYGTGTTRLFPPCPAS